jgi:hypothetical protein
MMAIFGSAYVLLEQIIWMQNDSMDDIKSKTFLLHKGDRPRNSSRRAFL